MDPPLSSSDHQKQQPSSPPSPSPTDEELEHTQRNPILFHEMEKEEQGSSSTYTVDEGLMALGFGPFQALVLAYAGMGWVSEAMEVMLLSFVGPAVAAQWKLSSHQESLITSAVFAGMLIGAYSSGILSDTFGRRMGFLFTALVTSVAGFMSSLANNYTSLIILRFFVGIGLGGGHVLASWFLEFIPAPNRGLWMVIFSCFWTVGTIFEASLAWIVMPALNWRWLLALSSLPSFILLLFYRVAPESPRYLCMRGRSTEAMVVMEKIARMNHAILPTGVVASDWQRAVDVESSPFEDTHLIAVENDEVMHEDREATKGGIHAVYKLLSPKLIKSTVLLWIAFFGNAFSYYGVVLLTSELSNSNRQCTSTKDMQAFQSDNNALYRDVFITSFAEFPGLLLAAVIVDRIGRKLSMSGMLFTSCVILIPLMNHQNELFMTIILFGTRMFINGSFAVLYIYAPEMYPTSVRATGVGTASSIGRIGGMVCPLVAVGLVHSCHQTQAILLFEFVIFFTGLAICLFPIETKGRKLNDSVHSLK